MATMEGKLPENILLFARLLRASGINIGSDGVTDSIAAVQTVGLKSRRAFYISLLTCLKKRKKTKDVQSLKRQTKTPNDLQLRKAQMKWQKFKLAWLPAVPIRTI